MSSSFAQKGSVRGDRKERKSVKRRKVRKNVREWKVRIKRMK